MFKYMDDTLKEMLPNAEIKFSPMIGSGSNHFNNSHRSQIAFRDISRLITSRDHVEFDSFMPLRNNMLEWDKIHLKDAEAIEFWKNIFQQL